MEARAAAVNLLWGSASARGWTQLRIALRSPADAQERLLLRYLRRNRNTAMGQTYGFGDIRSLSAYQARVPPMTYDDLEPRIRRAAGGEPHVLTAQKVERLVPSSGSTAAVKLVPFTRDLRGEFRRA